MVHVVITGGLGFLGVQAARRFLRSGQCWSRLANATRPIQKLTLFDRIPLPEDHALASVLSPELLRSCAAVCDGFDAPVLGGSERPVAARAEIDPSPLA